jgi:hypothetical protein
VQSGADLPLSSPLAIVAAQMFDPADPDRLGKTFLQEYQTLFGFGPESLDDANVQRDYPFAFAMTVFTHAWLSRYHRIVSRMPSSNLCAGVQPSSRWIFDASMA